MRTGSIALTVTRSLATAGDESDTVATPPQ